MKTIKETGIDNMFKRFILKAYEKLRCSNEETPRKKPHP
jgi:hypothetical protein